jgi:hypothetical protein
MRFIDLILKHFTERREHKSLEIVGKTGHIDFKKKYLSRKAADFFIAEGFTVQEKSVMNHAGKKTVAGMNVKIIPIKTNDYKAQGIIISIKCVGETMELLKWDMDRKEDRLLKYLTKKGIPFARMCVESEMTCVYKFENISCRVVETDEELEVPFK